jgi:hypothetical protein
MPSVEGVDDNVPPTGFGVLGRSSGGTGVFGDSINGPGVRGRSGDFDGVVGVSFSGNIFTSGVAGESRLGNGVIGRSNTGVGVRGESDSYVGVDASGATAVLAHTDATLGYGVFAVSSKHYGVLSGGGYIGVSGVGNKVGVAAYSSGKPTPDEERLPEEQRKRMYSALSAKSVSGYAAFLDGNVKITGTIQSVHLSFKIDHPLDPANKYLSHSFVESPDMKNVYDGVVVLDWFGALNKDFRYQLTAIGAPGPNLYISEEIPDGVTNSSRTSSNKNNNINSRFKVAGGASGMKVSWQVTRIRKDPWANAHRISVEEDKPAEERGYYTHPELYGQPEERGISRLLFPRDEEEKIKKKIMS